MLDVILSNNSSIVSFVRPDTPLGASDHVIIHFSIALANDYSHCNIEQNYSRNWLSADYDAIELYLSSVDWFNLLLCILLSQISGMFLCLFCTLLSICMSRNMPCLIPLFTVNPT